MAFWPFLVLAFLLLCSAQPCSSEIVIKFYAHMYTPELPGTEESPTLHALTKVARDWESMHPGVRIEFTPMPSGEFRTWMLTQLKGDVAPDIMWGHAAYVNEDARNYGWFVPLDSYLDKPNRYIKDPSALGSKRWRDLFYPAYMDQTRASNGKIYVLTLDLVETGFFYNKDLFRKLGLKAPETWADYMNVCRKLQDAGYVPVGFPGAGNFGQEWLTMTVTDQFWRDREAEMKVKKASVTVDAQEQIRAWKKGIWSLDSPRSREGFRLMKEWSKYWNKDYLTNQDRRLFLLGKEGMVWQGSWNYTSLLQSHLREFELGVFPFPRITKETSPSATGLPVRSPGGPATQYAISKSAVKHGTVDLCIDFLMYLSAPKQFEKVCSEQGCFVPNSPAMTGNPVLTPFMASLENGVSPFYGPLTIGNEDQRYRDGYNRELVRYLGGQLTLDELTHRLDTLTEESMERLITRNPQWQFDGNWDILPDKKISTTFEQSGVPASARFSLWVIAGLLVMGMVSVGMIHRRNIWRGLRMKKGIYLFILPTFLLLALFNYYPVFSAFYHSLFDWRGGGQAIWVGLRNFQEIFHDQQMGMASLNALWLMLASIFVGLTMPFIAAELIFHLRSARMQYVYRVLFVVPMVVPGVVTMLIWGMMYGYDLGVINQLFRAVGLQPQVWLGSPKLALYSLMLMGFPWIGGFALLVYYAGLQNISKDVLDSCKIDGAIGLSRILKIDLPLLLGQVKLLVVLGFIGGLQAFQTQLVLTNGGPGYSTMVPGLAMYQEAMYYDRMGYACAIGVVLFLAILAMTSVNLKYLRSSTEHEAR